MTIPDWFKGKVFADASSRYLYSRDQSEPPALARRLLTAEPLCVAQPQTLEDCSRLLAHLYRQGTPVVPRGAASFALGGVLPTRSAVILDLSPCRRVIGLDREAMTVTVEGGCRWSELIEYLQPHGCDVYTCPTSIFSTVAGWVATGGAGLGTLKHGYLRSLVVELLVLWPDGTAARLREGQPEFDLMFSSEGQLGVIWGVTLRICRRLRVQYPVLAACGDAQTALSLIPEACRFSPYSITFMNAARMAVAVGEHGVPAHLRHDNLLVVYDEVDSARSFERAVASKSTPLAAAGVARRVWNERFFPLRMKKHSPRGGGMLAADLVMPLAQLPEFLAWTDSAGRSYGVDIFCEAMLDTTGTAVTLPSFFSDPTDALRYGLHGYLALAIAREGVRMGGRPYGYGLWYAPFKRSDRTTIETQALKRRVDPQGLFNPGKNVRPSSILKAWNLLTRTALALRSLALPLGALVLRLLPRPHERAGVSSSLTRAIDACSSCGSCLAKCPAYIETSDERTTARGKIKLAASILQNGSAFTEAEQQVPFLCMHCKYCTEVCQSDIPLEDVYRELEALLASRVGWPERAVGEFVRSIESKGLMRALGLVGQAAMTSEVESPVPRKTRNGVLV